MGCNKNISTFLRQNSEYGKRDTSRDRINRRAENEWWLRLFDRRLPGRAGIYRQQKLCGRHLCGIVCPWGNMGYCPIRPFTDAQSCAERQRVLIVGTVFYLEGGMERQDEEGGKN